MGIAGKTWEIIRAYTYPPGNSVFLSTTASLTPYQSPQGSLKAAYLVLSSSLYISTTCHSMLYTPFYIHSLMTPNSFNTSNLSLTLTSYNRTSTKYSWSLDSDLTLHVDKTFLLRFHSSRIPEIETNYLLNNSTILVKSSCRDLGVFFSTDLSWSKHVHHIITKAYNQLHFIQRTFKAASTPTCVKKKLYLSLILPILSYASPVWRPYHMKDIKALELFQKRATKYILNYKNSDYKSRLSELNLLPLMSRLEYYDIMFFVSCWNHPGEHFNIRDFI